MMIPKCFCTTFSVAVLATTLLSAASNADFTDPSYCAQESDFVTNDGPLDFFPDKVSAEYSREWTIEYFDTYKILANLAENVTYLLYRCGTEPPPDSEGQHDIVLEVPHRGGIVVTSTTQIPHFEVLGVQEQINGYESSVSFLTSPCLNQRIADENDDSIQVLDDPDRSAREMIDEFLDTTDPTALVFVSSFGLDSAPKSNRVILSDSDEKQNRNTFEWHKFIAAFFNLERQATATFKTKDESYQCVTENSAKIEADLELRGLAKKKPVVLWAWYSPFFEAWSLAVCPNYYCEFARHCSANIINNLEGSIDNGFGGTVFTTEELVAIGKDADVWIFPSPDWESTFERFGDQLKDFKSVQNGRVYDNQGQGRNAWFEERLVDFDNVLLDFCDVVGTTSPLSPRRERRWFRDVQGPLNSAPKTCEASDLDMPVTPPLAECTPLRTCNRRTPVRVKNRCEFSLSEEGDGEEMGAIRGMVQHKSVFYAVTDDVLPAQMYTLKFRLAPKKGSCSAEVVEVCSLDVIGRATGIALKDPQAGTLYVSWESNDGIPSIREYDTKCNLLSDNGGDFFTVPESFASGQSLNSLTVSLPGGEGSSKTIFAATEEGDEGNQRLSRVLSMDAASGDVKAEFIYIHDDDSGTAGLTDFLALDSVGTLLTVERSEETTRLFEIVVHSGANVAGVATTMDNFNMDWGVTKTLVADLGRSTATGAPWESVAFERLGRNRARILVATSSASSPPEFLFSELRWQEKSVIGELATGLSNTALQLNLADDLVKDARRAGKLANKKRNVKVNAVNDRVSKVIAGLSSGCFLEDIAGDVACIYLQGLAEDLSQCLAFLELL